MHVVVLMCVTSTTSLAGIRGGQDSIAEPLFVVRDVLLENFSAFSDCWLWVGSVERLGEKKDAGDVLGSHLKKKVTLEEIGVEGRIILKLNCECERYSFDPP